MQLLILLIVNLIIFAVFYLIISLKLEKSASEFREKKLRKEMDDIIKEFNATAERNISILENRIAVFKNLLNLSENVKRIDSVVGSRKSGDLVQHKKQLSHESETKDPNETPETLLQPVQRHTIHKKKTRRNLISYFLEAYQSYKHERKNENTSSAVDTTVLEKKVHPEPLADIAHPVGKGKHFNILIEKEFKKSDFFSPQENKSEAISADTHKQDDELKDSEQLSEEEIQHLLNSTDDKYKIISVLYDKGFAVDTIADYSGIPVGEVKLVLNLNGSL